MIMNAQILLAGTDRGHAAALDWIKQTAASGKTLSPPRDDGPGYTGTGRRAAPDNHQRGCPC